MSSTDELETPSLFPLHCLNNLAEENFSFMEHLLSLDMKMQSKRRKLCRTPPVFRPGGLKRAGPLGRSPLGRYIYSCSSKEDIDESPREIHPVAAVLEQERINEPSIDDINKTAIHTEHDINNEPHIETLPKSNFDIEEKAKRGPEGDQEPKLALPMRISPQTPIPNPTAAKDTALNEICLALQMVMLSPNSQNERIPKERTAAAYC